MKKGIKFILLVLVLGIVSFITYKNFSNKEIEVINKTQINEENVEDTNINNFGDLEVTNDEVGVTVLGYHSINLDPNGKNPIAIDKERFRSHLQAIEDSGYTTLTMSQLNNYLNNNQPIPPKSVVITFDDGYMDNYENAFPLLKEFNMNATIFIIPGMMDGNIYMSEKEVKELIDYGIDIQSHTLNHEELATISYDKQKEEITKAKALIEDITKKPVISIAYPYGSYNEDTIKITEEAGYNMAFTVERGYAKRNINKFKINRVLIDYTYGINDIKKVLKKSN